MAPKAAEKAPAKKTPAKTAEGSKKKKKLNKAETYKVYIYKVLKQVRRLRAARHCEAQEESRDLNNFVRERERLALAWLSLCWNIISARTGLLAADKGFGAGSKPPR